MNSGGYLTSPKVLSSGGESELSKLMEPDWFMQRPSTGAKEAIPPQTQRFKGSVTFDLQSKKGSTMKETDLSTNRTKSS